MTYTEAIDYMRSLKAVGMQMGLERMAIAVEELRHPERSFRAVHIAGTNGKGSTAHMIAAMCHASGHHTGLYTSPFLTSPRDAIRIDGEPISEKDFADCAADVRDTVSASLSEYEFLTLVAFCAFRKSGVSLGVVECCLGGATDTTNILPPPLCAVFTPVSYDHTAILGDTLTAIAAQKGGIIKSPCDVVCAPSMETEALGTLYEIAATRGVTLTQPSSHAIGEPIITRDGTRFSYADQSFSTAMLGVHQCENTVTAWTVMERLQKHGIAFDPVAAKNALASVTLPCRQEILCREPLVMLDGAHNPHGIDALCRTLHALSLSDVTLVIGMLADKAVESCLRKLAPLCRQILCTTPKGTPRAMAASDLAAIAEQIHPSVQVIPEPIDAVREAQKSAKNHAIIIGGSFYTAAAVRDAIKKSLTDSSR